MGIAPALLPIVAFAPVARASGPAGAAGGASRRAAAALATGVSFRGQLAPARQAWYELYAGPGERVSVRLWGRTRSCPVRMTVIDAHGRALGEIASTTREIEPFIVYTPENDSSSKYYLRVQQDASSTRCASAAYVFTLQEPEQAVVRCESTTDANGEPLRSCTAPSKETAVPADEARVCATASRSYRRLEREYARQRSSAARRRLQRAIGAARRTVIHGCRY